MEITVRKLDTAAEKTEAEKLIATSFLHDWDAEEAEKNMESPDYEVWAAFDGQGRMVSAISALRRSLTYEGEIITCGELHMAGTLPEARGSGAIRKQIGVILKEFRARGDLFAFLIPFSFAFYRKYGFEAVSEMLVQSAEIGQFSGFEQEMQASRIASQADADEARRLYEGFAVRYNLADLKDEEEWTCREDGEFGRRDWQYADKVHYSYLFRDADGRARAYVTFVFVHGPEGPFTGIMKITELVFDSPEALRSVFGFFYGMRAKITEVCAETPADTDFSILLPECDKVKRTLDGHIMARALNIEKILHAMRQPEGEGQYSIRITDGFLPENTGTYTVRFKEGRAAEVVRNEAAADLEVTEETFCQLSAGRIGLGAARYRRGTELNGNRKLLEQVFTEKTVFLR